MTFPLITFDTPVQVSSDNDLTTDRMSILEVQDLTNVQQLWVVLQLETDPISNQRLLIYEHDEYLDLGDWTYESLAARVKLYYESGRSFPHYVSPNVPVEEEPAPDEKPAPEGE